MITRRKLLKSTAATGLTFAAGGLAAPALAQGAKIRLGYVSPQSGPLAAFSEADQFIIDGFLGSEAGANFEVIVKDSQSNPNRAAEVAKDLIIDDEIDICWYFWLSLYIHSLKNKPVIFGCRLKRQLDRLSCM